MKKISTRALSVFLIAALVFTGMCVFIREEYLHGRKWAMYFSMFNPEADGQLLDRNGIMLAAFNKDARVYAKDWPTRVSNYHVTGDYAGMTGTGVLNRFWGSASDYDFIYGIHNERSGSLSLGIDAELNNYAYSLLSQYGKGTVMIMNYKTGEVICLVSSPSVDPAYPDEEPEDGAYVNRALTATYTPGSTFKLITSAAAIENVPDLENMTFRCTGELDIAGISITCMEAHGTQTFEQALANSCNCAFAYLTYMEVGQRLMVKYVTDYGFLSPHSIDGIFTSAGNYPTEFVGDPELAWSGIGQSTDQVCPFSMLRYVSAIANGGTLAEPTFVKGGSNGKSTLLVNPATASRLQELMRNNVVSHYAQEIPSFQDLPFCAKTGTAETGAGTSHSWFTGFLQDEAHPYAFVAVIEEGGFGLWAAGIMVNDIFQHMLQKAGTT